MINSNWVVHKFGGTSVLNAERYKIVYEILSQKLPKGPKAVVVSAMKGVTDDLIHLVQMAQQKNEDYKNKIQSILNRHLQEINQLIPSENSELKINLVSVLKNDFFEISEILRSVWLTQSASSTIIEQISGMGEVWSAQILNAYLKSINQNSNWLDARKILIVEKNSTRVQVDWEKSKHNLTQYLSSNQNLNSNGYICITGFVASDSSGISTTLGRNGSDYSGSIFGALFQSSEIFIWTDVDGVLSADPRLVKDAIVLDELSYHEVTELAYFGAKVVHPATMTPAIINSIPIRIKNTFNPNHPGTFIHSKTNSTRAVKGFSCIDKMSLLNLEGTGMIGIPGVSERLFSALRSAQVNVVLISQASSEQSICLAVDQSETERAEHAINHAFAIEIQKQLIYPVQITRHVSILAAVGDNMPQTPGIAGRFFSALGQSKVNVRAIAQGSSERNISAVIDSADSIKALRTVHSAFIEPFLNISVGLVGVGLIGNTFLEQLKEQHETLKSQRKINVHISALANSKKMWLLSSGHDWTKWKSDFEKFCEPLDLKKLSHHIKNDYIPHSVIIESTASQDLIPKYTEWLDSGHHIISPNKKANSDRFSDYCKIRDSINKSKKHFLYSTNVGAGLPIIQTLRDLINTGDEIIEIEGILSGTLSYIFNQFDGTKPFSEIVTTAKENGFTEPDPRDDLSGQDVVRKLVILARENKMRTEITDVVVEGLIPSELKDIPLSDFMLRLKEMDIEMADRIKQAKSKNEILRFVACLDKNGVAKVGLKNLPNHHVFSKVSGTDNIVLFKTKRYFKQPLVIQGPGAGPEVTAAGVFADLLRLVQYLGALP